MSQLTLNRLAQDATDRIGIRMGLSLGALGLAGTAAVALLCFKYFKRPTRKLEPGGRVIPDEAELSEKEQQLSKDLIKAAEIQTDFSDIGGLRQQVSRDRSGCSEAAHCVTGALAFTHRITAD